MGQYSKFWAALIGAGVMVGQAAIDKWVAPGTLQSWHPWIEMGIGLITAIFVRQVPNK